KKQVLERLMQLEYINDRCIQIEVSQGVVYAIRPNEELINGLYVDHNVIFSRLPIFPNQIIAKAIINDDYQIPNEVTDRIKEKINNNLITPGSIGLYLRKRDMENGMEGL